MLYFAKYFPLYLSLIKALKYLYTISWFGFCFTVTLSEKLKNGIVKHTS